MITTFYRYFVLLAVSGGLLVQAAPVSNEARQLLPPPFDGVVGGLPVVGPILGGGSTQPPTTQPPPATSEPEPRDVTLGARQLLPPPFDGVVGGLPVVGPILGGGTTQPPTTQPPPATSEPEPRGIDTTLEARQLLPPPFDGVVGGLPVVGPILGGGTTQPPTTQPPPATSEPEPRGIDTTLEARQLLPPPFDGVVGGLPVVGPILGGGTARRYFRSTSTAPPPFDGVVGGLPVVGPILGGGTQPPTTQPPPATSEPEPRGIDTTLEARQLLPPPFDGVVGGLPVVGPILGGGTTQPPTTQPPPATSEPEPREIDATLGARQLLPPPFDGVVGGLPVVGPILGGGATQPPPAQAPPATSEPEPRQIGTIFGPTIESTGQALGLLPPPPPSGDDG
ncbi:hypothetical protein D9756_000114 [Leucocoprinus leucothites]|uniref:Uncharacterized protein n=1 Tax=Leucocoprinus leucothites TaxID=201217 RepID=A0A8H5GF28_9AGAR|nr:hypothetical protein D9756_000114 [Leucoagaricus leucothites]